MMIPRIYPYIGLNDFTDPAAVQDVYRFFLEAAKEKLRRSLGVGVMMSRESLNDMPSKWTEIFAPKDVIASIFAEKPYLFHILHYVDYTPGGTDVVANLEKARDLCGDHLGAIQLDMTWPSPTALREYRQSCDPLTPIILQVHGVSIEFAGGDPEGVVSRLKEYGVFIDGVLLDLSRGTGREMDADVLLPYVRAIKSHLPQLSITVAGGLGPDTLHLVEPILREFPGTSFDMQSKLHVNDDSRQPVDRDKTERALVRALELCAAYD